MATFIVTPCDCGRAAQVYVPKVKMAAAMGMDPEEARLADLQDIEDGDFEGGGYMHAITGQRPATPRPHVHGQKPGPPEYPTHCVCGRPFPTADEIVAEMVHRQKHHKPDPAN